ncbi:tetratricopeptide repeat protein [Neisseria shayeganii 871]|uniref:Tetratricopeptide repeat protein n=2 Tax=Neisseria shayeganii TaxID=607712 RepID=G4CK48_9NEIS|nr:tetratricopeptide repeat protein [Neisseria shayeganii 871]
MLFWRKRMIPLLAACLAVSAPVWSAPAGKSPDGGQMSHRDIIDRANNMMTALAAEMSLQQNQGGTALAGYLRVFERSKDPAVAERAVEIALAGNIRLAEQMLERWQRAEPQPSPEQKRMRWTVAAAKGDLNTVEANLPEVLAQDDRNRMRGVFLRLAQLALRQPEAANARNARLVHEAALRFPSLPEAAMSDAIYSAQQNRKRDAAAALNRLAQLDTDIRPTTRLTLGLIARRRPEVLHHFFAGTDDHRLSPMWQGLKVDSLIHSGRENEAYGLLQSLLAKNPDPDFYIQAGVLSTRRKEPAAVSLNYFDKAYLLGTSQQKSRAALFAATRALEEKDFETARLWNTRMEAPESAFDRLMVAAHIETAAENWTAADDLLLRAESLHPHENGLYGPADLLQAQLNIAAKLPLTEALHRLNGLHRQHGNADAGSAESAAAVLYSRALLYADRLEQPDKAVADLREALRLFPKHADTLNALGYTMLALPDADLAEARRHIEQAHRLDPQSPAIRDSLGWVLFKQGDARAALPHLEAAYRALPEAEVGAHLGEVLWQLGRRDEARQIWQTVAGKGGNQKVLQDTLQRLGVELPPADQARQ